MKIYFKYVNLDNYIVDNYNKYDKISKKYLPNYEDSRLAIRSTS